MQSYLIVSTNKDFIKSEVDKITILLNVSSYNLHDISPDPSIGINEVRKLQEILSRKTFQGGDRIIIIRDLEKATVEASNAMLKIIEETPPATYIILITNNLNRILPTVASRCQIITDKENNLQHFSFDEKKVSSLLQEILKASPGERILISQNLAKSKEETVKLLDTFTAYLRQLLYKDAKEIALSPGNIASLISKVTSAKRYLEKNVNYKATLDILFLGFPQ